MGGHQGDSDLLKNTEGQNRSLYSLRHIYTTLAMLRGEVEIHTLSKQMGKRADMIERHYSKFTEALAAEKKHKCVDL